MHRDPIYQRKKIPIITAAAIVLIAGAAALILLSPKPTIPNSGGSIVSDADEVFTEEENAENTDDDISAEVPAPTEVVSPEVPEVPSVDETVASGELTPVRTEAVIEDELIPKVMTPSEVETPPNNNAITQTVPPVEDVLSTERDESTVNVEPSEEIMSSEDVSSTENTNSNEVVSSAEDINSREVVLSTEDANSSEVVSPSEDTNSSEVVLPSENVDSSVDDVPVELTDTDVTVPTVELGVIFNNSHIEGSVRAALNKLEGVLLEDDLSSVKKIYITGKDLTDISDLTKLPGLTVVYLSNNKITDISSLAGLTGLKELVLNNNNISDITVLKGLTNLETLNLSSNEITDVSPLIGLRKLKKLYLNGNEGLTDVSMLSDLALDVYVGPSMSPVVTFENHTIEEEIRAVLNLKEGEMIREEDLSRVKSLDLSRTGTVSIDELTELTNLESLTLADNEIEDISILGSLSDLNVLVLKNNRVEDISALQSLKNLSTLDLSENAVSDISALSEMKDMKNLYLSGNQITDLAPLSNLKEIEVLHIDGVSEDMDLAHLSGMRNLKEYKGPEVKWPVDMDATIVGLWSGEVKDIAISKIAFGDAFAAGGITRTGSIEVSNEKAIEYLNGCIEGTIQPEVKIDGICLFPYKGIRLYRITCKGGCEWSRYSHYVCR